MRIAALIALAALAPTAAMAQGAPMIGYVEGGLGLTIIGNVDTAPLTVFVPGTGTFSGTAKGSYGTRMTAGAELGTTFGNWRVGISYDYTDAKLNSATATGTLNGQPFTATYPGAVIKGFGYNFDTNVQLFSGNVYYNLPLIGDLIRPYVGLGVGAALIDKARTELAISGTLGARIGISDNIYIGPKYRIMRIGGTRDDLGTQYEDMVVHTFMGVIGFYLN